MANPRTVINPFTKNEQRMKRNTKNTKWVTTGSTTINRRNVDVGTQALKVISQESISLSDVKNVPPGARAPRSPRDEMRPLPPEPTTVRTNASHRDTPLSTIQLIDFSRLEQTLKESDVNISPHCSASLEEPKSNNNSSWRRRNLYETFNTSLDTSSKQTHIQQQANCSPTPLYRAAKEIYHIGPKGEGQKVWEAYQQTCSYRRADGELIHNGPYERMDEEKNTESLLPPLSTNPDGLLFPPLRPRSPKAQRGGRGREFGSPDLRKDSGFSSSSYEVPVVIDKSIQSTVDTNKPLPPVPQLDAAPKARRTKDMPLEESRQKTEKEATHTWWKHSPFKAPQTLKSKISYPGPLMVSSEGIAVNIAAECGGVGGPAAAISLPVTRTGVPLARPPSTHDEKRKEAGRPSPRSFHLPTFRLSPSNSKRTGQERAKMDDIDDTSSTHWRDKLVGPAYEASKSLKHTAMETLEGVHTGRKNRSSDVSFTCQGMVGERLDRYQVSERFSSDDEKDLIPDPLFYNKRLGTDT